MDGFGNMEELRRILVDLVALPVSGRFSGALKNVVHVEQV